jgi:predicted phosphodiesterase
MQIQYCSDIHLEFHDKSDKGDLSPEMFIKPSAPYLALAGDIGIPDLQSYEVFLGWCSKNWKQVFLVAGNHEYYNYRCPVKTDMTVKRAKIREVMAKFPNVVFLDRSSIYVADEGVRILGCTLWSHIPDEHAHNAILSMNDARQILCAGDIVFSPWKFSELHALEKQWLSDEIDRAAGAGEKCLVITHYMPSFSLIHPKYQGLSLNCCFASESDDLFRPPVVGWICGHTHTGGEFKIHDIPCVLNPFGYPTEVVKTRSRTAVLTV